MRNKVAKALRKEVEFNPNAEREYRAFTVPVMRNILQWDTDKKKVAVVKREVDATIVECVDGARKLYNYLKRKYKNFEHEETLHHLPTDEELLELKNTIVGEEKSNPTLNANVAAEEAAKENEE